MAKNKVVMSVVAAAMVASAASADVKVSGDLRAMYFSNDATAVDGSEVNVGANALLEVSGGEGLGFGVGFGTASDFMVEEDDNDVDKDVTGVPDYMIINNFYAAYTTGKTTFKVGRQILNTPGAGADDIRMTPNGFEAFVVINGDLPNTTLIAAQATGMTGWDSYGDEGFTGYASMTDAALGVTGLGGANIEDNPATILAAIYGKDAFNASLWYYTILDETSLTGLGKASSISLTYVDASYAFAMGKSNLTLAGQYISFGGDIDLAAGGSIDLAHSIAGVKADYAMGALSLMAAVNSVDGEHNVLDAWGGYPEYAIADEYWMNMFNNKVFTSFKVGAGYTVADVKLGAAYTAFSGDEDEGATETANVVDVTVGYGPLSLVYEAVTEEYSAGGDDDWNILKLSVTKTF